MRPYSKDKAVPAPHHTARALKRVEAPALWGKKILVFESDVNKYMKDNGIRTATRRRRLKIASHLRKVKYVQMVEI